MNSRMLKKAQTALAEAEYVIVLAGAGMSAELGLPVYYKGKDARYGGQVMSTGLTAMEHANAQLWHENREMQIEFFHDSLQDILNIPIEDESNHYHVLRNYLERGSKEYFVMTSNIDRAFARSGFAEDRIYEIHGSRLKSQCLDYPGHGVFRTLCNGERTVCPLCQGDTRPNVMFFNDYEFNYSAVAKQENNYVGFRSRVAGRKAVALEIGAGTTVATIRNQSAILNHHFDMPVVRINVDTDDGTDILPPADAPIIRVPMSASDGIKALTRSRQQKKGWRLF